MKSGAAYLNPLWPRRLGQRPVISKIRTLSVIRSFALHFVIICLALLWLSPLWMMLVFATHDESAIYADPQPVWIGNDFPDNFSRLNTKFDFLSAIFNSIVVAGSYTLLSLMLCSMAGYAFARYRFFGKQALFAMVLATMALPLMAVLIPQYLLVAKKMGMANTYVGVVLPYLANSMGVFFMRQIFLSLPQGVLDAARIEGAAEARIFWQIALPMVRPAVGALAIIIFLAGWNDYLWPLLVLTDKSMFTAPVAMGTLMGIARINYSVIMAGVVLMAMPFVVLFLFLQRQLVAGITLGSVK